MAYHDRRFVSVFAFNERGGKERLVAESHPKDRSDVYICAFALAKNVYDLAHFVPDYTAYDQAILGLSKAFNVLARKRPDAAVGNIELDDVVPAEVSRNLTYDEWYPKQLSKRQREFVDHELVGPLRLRGGRYRQNASNDN